MNVEDNNVVQLSTWIRGDLLLELLGLKLKSSERRKPQSGEDAEEIGYDMDFRGEI